MPKPDDYLRDLQVLTPSELAKHPRDDELKEELDALVDPKDRYHQD